jgi:hypothetical protein
MIDFISGSVVGINLSGNHLRGNFPENSAWNLPNLAMINLSNNSISGKVPQIFLAGIPSIKHLDFSANFLDGALPFFSNLSKMEYINLNSNR